jgi:hypothetical protein
MSDKIIKDEQLQIIIKVLVDATHRNFAFADINNLILQLQRLPEIPKPEEAKETK